MNQKILSIIIPVYNVEDYLDKCIESVIRQTLDSIEVILINDGSSDSSGIICDKWKELDPRIIVIHKNNEGVASARNSGLEIASGTYITFLDSDDYIESTMYECMIRMMEDQGSDLVICGALEHSVDGIKEICSDMKKFTGQEAMRHLLLWDGKITSHLWNKLYKKELIKDLRFYDDLIYGEDTPFLFEYLKRCKDVFQIEKCFYHYVRRENSLIGNEYKHRHILSLDASKMVAENCFRECPELKNEAKCHIAMNCYFLLANLLQNKENLNSYYEDYEILINEMRKYSTGLIRKYYSKKRCMQWFLCKHYPKIFAAIKHIVKRNIK